MEERKRKVTSYENYEDANNVTDQGYSTITNKSAVRQVQMYAEIQINTVAEPQAPGVGEYNYMI